MYILSLLLFIISIYIFCSNPRSELRRWFAAFIFFVALGVLSIALNMAHYKPTSSELEYWINSHLSSYIFSESNYFMPYTLLVFSVLLTGRYEGSRKYSLILVKLLLLLPIIFMHIKAPPGNSFNNNLFDTLYIPWSLLYYLFSSILAVYAWLREKDRKKRLKKMILCFAVLLINTTTIVFGYALPLAYKTHFYELLQSMIIVITLLFSFIALRYDMLGLRLRIEREHYHSMMGSMTPGAALLSHSIKNEISKIAVCTDNIRSTTINENPYVSDNIGIIDNSLAHLAELTQKIKIQMQEYELNESGNRLIDIVEDSLVLANPILNRKKISIIKHYHADIDIVCDRMHLKEVLINLLVNAAEAMNEEGKIEISTWVKKRGVYILIRDNGKGISPKDMPFIFNPFFTTKKQSRNYGLGLSYCYSVIKKHGGSIRIKNGKTVGTEAYLIFPRKKVIRCTSEGSDSRG